MDEHFMRPKNCQNIPLRWDRQNSMPSNPSENGIRQHKAQLGTRLILPLLHQTNWKILHHRHAPEQSTDSSIKLQRRNRGLGTVHQISYRMDRIPRMHGCSINCRRIFQSPKRIQLPIKMPASRRHSIATDKKIRMPWLKDSTLRQQNIQTTQKRRSTIHVQQPLPTPQHRGNRQKITETGDNIRGAIKNLERIKAKLEVIEYQEMHAQSMQNKSIIEADRKEISKDIHSERELITRLWRDHKLLMDQR